MSNDIRKQAVTYDFNGQVAAADKLLDEHVFNKYPATKIIKDKLPPIRLGHIAIGLVAILCLSIISYLLAVMH